MSHSLIVTCVYGGREGAGGTGLWTDPATGQTIMQLNNLIDRYSGRKQKAFRVYAQISNHKLTDISEL